MQRKHCPFDMIGSSSHSSIHCSVCAIKAANESMCVSSVIPHYLSVFDLRTSEVVIARSCTESTTHLACQGHDSGIKFT